MSDSFKVKNRLNIHPNTSAGAETGDIRVDSSDSNRLKFYNGSSEAIVPTVSSTDALTNKTIDADSNTISNIADANIKAAAAIDAAKIADGSVSNTEFQYLGNVTSDIQTQINSKITSGTASIVNADISASAAIDASKIADGSVSNAEFQRLDGVTSAIQTQLNAKAPTASPTFSGTITTPLTASRAVVTGASSELAASTTTATELGYVNGVTSAIQTQLDAKQPLDSDLTAVAGLSSNGLIARTGSGTASVRTITAGSSKVSVSNGDGVSGNPSVDVTEANLTLGNLGGTLGVTKGGTGQTTASAAFDALSPNTTLGDITYRDSSTNARLAGNTSATKKFLSQTGNGSVSAAPAWSQPFFSDITGTASLTTQVTGTLPVANGGTGQASYTDGQLLIGNSSTGLLSKATLTQGSNITITNGNGSITIAASSSANPAWSYTSQTSNYSASVGDWVLASSSAFTITLPTAVGQSGKSIRVQHNGSNFVKYTIHSTSSQTITHAGTTYTNTDINTNDLVAAYTAGELYEFTSDGANWICSAHSARTGETVISSGLSLSTTSNYTFTITSATVVAGDVYSNNSQSFVVTSSGTVTSMPASGTGAPAASGTLTRTFGTGPSTLTFSAASTSSSAKGSVTADNFIWWRDGKYVNYRYDVNWAAGTQGTGDNRYFYPTGLQPDLTNLQTNPTTGNPTKWSILGNGQVTSNNNTLRQQGYFISANNLAMSLHINTVGMQGSGNYAISSQTAFSIIGSYPVTGWLP